MAQVPYAHILAKGPVAVNGVLAYNVGDPIPLSVANRLGLPYVSGDILPPFSGGGEFDNFTDLVTQHELDLALAGLGFGGSSHTANSVLAAVGGTTIADLAVPPSTLLGRGPSGSLAALSTAQVLTLLAVYTAAQTDSAIATAIAALIASSPSTLNTLKELADALGDDPNFATTIATALGAKVATAGHGANSVPVSTSGALADLAMGASTILARLASGNIVAATPAQLKTLLAIAEADVVGLSADLTTLTAAIAAKATDTAVVHNTLADANSILYAVTDDTPAALAMAASTIPARLASGNIVAATMAQIRTLLALASTDLSDFTEATQDVVGSLLADSSTIDYTYNDAGNAESIAIIAASITTSLLAAGAVTPPKLAAAIALTDGANIATDASLGSVFKVTLGGNRTIDNPTNPTAGQKLIYRLKQDATGSRTITWGSAFRWGADVPVPTLTTTAAKTDYIGFVYNSDDTKWDGLAVARGY